MDAFMNWFFAFMTTILEGLWNGIKGIFNAIFQFFNFPEIFDQLSRYKSGFNVMGWILCVLTILITYAILAAVIFLIILGVRKYLRFRKTIVGNEDMLEEIAELHRDVIRLTEEKERILAHKFDPSGVTYEEIHRFLKSEGEAKGEPGKTTAVAPASGTAAPAEARKDGPAEAGGKRFYRLSAVDDKYTYYLPPQYENVMSLEELCTDIRNFACSRNKLYYEIKTVRLMIAGLASTKLILLQGISGTGKTSLPYMLGKYFQVDSTIASVQPSWRDRTELFGFFNEFTKKFNETEVLKRIYEASYNDDINIIILDEMNIARVEYYFAEMLSILEMPNADEWKIELVPSAWPGDPQKLRDGKLQIPQNVWYIGTANNDDSTFAISDKVYDRALVINLDSKGVPFEAPETAPKCISYSYVESLYAKAMEEHPVSDELINKIGSLDLYVIEKFRVAFGNRIIKQLRTFVPVYVACGGTELEGVDYILATKVFRKFESLNLSLIRDEIRGLIMYMEKLFGKGEMNECIEYLQRLQKMMY
ncbi:MAG: hypothetical protein J5793_01020 [Clostridia bacterium]|nr:hypothetical protein [Clostridia bacterium]